MTVLAFPTQQRRQKLASTLWRQLRVVLLHVSVLGKGQPVALLVSTGHSPASPPPSCSVLLPTPHPCYQSAPKPSACAPIMGRAPCLQLCILWHGVRSGQSQWFGHWNEDRKVTKLPGERIHCGIRGPTTGRGWGLSDVGATSVKTHRAVAHTDGTLCGRDRPPGPMQGGAGFPGASPRLPRDGEPTPHPCSG